MEERSVVLIDAENMVTSWREYCQRNGVSDKLDYFKAVNLLADGTNLLRAYLK